MGALTDAALASLDTDIGNLTTYVQGLQADSGSDAATADAINAAAAKLTALIPPPATVPSALTVTASDVNAPLAQALTASPLSVSGGTPPYTVALSGLPDGITADASGNLSGTPTTSGTSTVSVSVTDSASPANTGTGSFTVTVA